MDEVKVEESAPASTAAPAGRQLVPGLLYIEDKSANIGTKVNFILLVSYKKSMSDQISSPGY